jgi:hypothetical protein
MSDTTSALPLRMSLTMPLTKLPPRTRSSRTCSLNRKLLLPRVEPISNDVLCKNSESHQRTSYVRHNYIQSGIKLCQSNITNSRPSPQLICRTEPTSEFFFFPPVCGPATRSAINQSSPPRERPSLHSLCPGNDISNKRLAISRRSPKLSRLVRPSIIIGQSHAAPGHHSTKTLPNF